MRFWPRSLLGQVLLTVALALLVAQTVSAVMLVRAGENRRDQAALNAAAFRFLAPPRGNRQQAENRLERRFGEERPRMPGQRIRSEGRFGGRGLRLENAPDSPVLAGERRRTQLENEMRIILAGQGLAADELVVVKRLSTRDPLIQSRPRLLRRLTESGKTDRLLLVAGLKQPGRSVWQVARVPMPDSAGGGLTAIIAQTLILYAVLVGLLFFLLRRITGPLAALTARTMRFGQGNAMTNPLEPSGPDDVRRLMAAHNSMEARIGALLKEKDIMLGAIGHDLKTPLAALRVRIETVEDEQERGKMAASIMDITQTLDDILTLARVGKAPEPPDRAELSALLAAVVEEFQDRGKPVALVKAERIVHPVYLTWLKRAVRNLISNAVRYGGTAEVSLVAEESTIILRIDDHGPGIADDQIAAMLEPFKRGEISRNRATGGAGLGLTISRAIARQHGGDLLLQNRPEGGLRAELQLPRA
ncbi:sensor histidine kinase [Pontixanthobacter sp.]|uniref:sensor histidine kinase n=1 Tax=Pontixanthobacter sp. TaxID=2792078 RepID=UPI003C7E26E7